MSQDLEIVFSEEKYLERDLEKGICAAEAAGRQRGGSGDAAELGAAAHGVESGWQGRPQRKLRRSVSIVGIFFSRKITGFLQQHIIVIIFKVYLKTLIYSRKSILSILERSGRKTAAGAL